MVIKGSKAVIFVKHVGTIAAPWRVSAAIKPGPDKPAKRISIGMATSKPEAMKIAQNAKTKLEKRVENVRINS